MGVTQYRKDILAKMGWDKARIDGLLAANEQGSRQLAAVEPDIIKVGLRR